MRVSPTAAGVALAGVLLCGLGGCAMPEAGGTDDDRTPPAPQADLSFAYEAVGGAGFIDQTLTIINNGDAAAAPDLDIVPLDADGADLVDVSVVTAYGSDEGDQVVPALTEVIEVLKFKGPEAALVDDVRVEVVDVGMLDLDVPPANDLKVKRYDISGKKTKNASTLGAVSVKNPYDAPVTVAIVGIQYAAPKDGEPQHFKQVSALVGPMVVAPGEKVRVKVPSKYRTRFFGSVKAYLTQA